MSLFRPKNLVCPNCEALITMDAVGSINADRRPDYRDAILDNDFQDVSCGSCGKGFRLQPEFNYLDAGRGQWIASLPAARMPEYILVEDEANTLFAASYGEKAPASAREIGRNLQMRVTFGWPAIREKLLIRQSELDDTVIELVKLDLLRRVSSAPLKPGVELRLTEVLEDMLVMVWLDTATEAVIEELQVPRGLYDAIAGDPEPWAPTHAKLTDGPFVDMQKLYMGPGRGAPAP
ncbi:MAG: CpXC domain-containing protein [Pseudorhodobacter sp.]